MFGSLKFIHKWTECSLSLPRSHFSIKCHRHIKIMYHIPLFYECTYDKNRAHTIRIGFNGFYGLVHTTHVHRYDGQFWSVCCQFNWGFELPFRIFMYVMMNWPHKEQLERNKTEKMYRNSIKPVKWNRMLAQGPRVNDGKYYVYNFITNGI